MPVFIEKSYKSILNKKKSIDSWFWDSYTLNPYNGCLFGCIYCDARKAKYHMPEDFENQIIIKKDIAKLLRHQLKQKPFRLAQNIQQLKLGINRENLKDIVLLNFPGKAHFIAKLERPFLIKQWFLPVLVNFKKTAEMC